MVFANPDSVSTNRRPHTSRVVGGEGTDLKQTDGRQIVRAGGPKEDLDYDIDAHDLVGEGDLTIPDDISTDTELSTDGNGFVTLVVESTEATPQTFTVTYQFLADDGSVLFSYGPSKDADLTDTWFFVNTSIGSKGMKIVLSDASGAGSNTIKGSLNIHP